MVAIMRIRWLVWIVSTVVLVMVIGQAQLASGQPLEIIEKSEEEEAIGVAIDKAKALLEQEEYDDALGNINQVIRDLDKLSSSGTSLLTSEVEALLAAQAHLTRGEIYTAMKQWRAAIDSYNAAITDGEELDDEAKARARTGRGEAYIELGDPSSALGDFNMAAQIEWTNKEYLYNQGSTLVKMRAPQPAIEILDRVLEIDDQYADAYNARGQAHGLLSQAKPEELELAMADFGNALKIDPEKKEYYYDAGIVLMQNERLVEAIASFTSALAKDQAQRAAQSGQAPEDATPEGAEAAPASTLTVDESNADDEEGPYIQPLLARSMAYVELGKKSTDAKVRTEVYRRAVADTELALELVPKIPDSFLMQGIALRLLEEYDQSIASFTEALRINPEYTEAIYRRGIVWYHLGENQVALDDLIEASQLSPDDVRPYMWQGFTHARLGDYYAAVNAYAQAIEQDAHFPTAFDNRGLAYLHLGQYDKAIDDFDQVLRIEPTDAGAYFKRGVAHDLAGNDQLAIESYRAAIRIDPDQVDAYLRLADAYQRQGLNEDADQASGDADAARQRVEEKSQQPSEESAESGQPPATLPDSLPFAVPLESDLFAPPSGDLFPTPDVPDQPADPPLPGFEIPDDQTGPAPLDLGPQGDSGAPAETAPAEEDVPLF
ncbi:MAG: tetratricopeptide repeat protein [Pirellulales bacterium]